MSPPSRPSTLRPRRVSGRQVVELAHQFDAALVGGPGDALVTGVTLDSRLVAPGDLYVGLPGRSHHGAGFAAAAARAGAVAVLTDAPGQGLVQGLDRPVLVVNDPRSAMATIAAWVYGEPSRAMTMFAVTGTNGKTTTSYLLDAALRHAGTRTGVVGTIGFRLDGNALEGARTTVTTPESPELQGLLAVLAEDGAQACVMEVSSHALALGRVDAITFDVAAFTNFGRDHLDFHGDLESYFAAKARLFTPERTRAAVVNVDDPRGPVLVERLRARAVGVATVSLNDPEANYLVTALRGAAGASVVSLRTPTDRLEFRLALPGEFNVRNAVTALAMLDRQGVDLESAAAGLADAQVPGRMQRVELGAGAPAVFVDFAHTPQAVAAALAALAGRRRIAVLGAGGDRDPDKRAPIGAAAAAGAEVVVVTDDNPRSEDPAAIRRQVLSGAEATRRAEHLSVDVLDGGDRRTAIRAALELAGPEDVVAVLGKGHETGQQVADRVLPFDDAEVVRSEWSRAHHSSVTSALAEEAGA